MDEAHRIREGDPNARLPLVRAIDLLIGDAPVYGECACHNSVEDPAGEVIAALLELDKFATWSALNRPEYPRLRAAIDAYRKGKEDDPAAETDY